MPHLTIYSNIFRMMVTLWRLRRQERWTRTQIEKHQASALQRLRAHAYAHSPFYQKFHAGLLDRPLHELPILTRSHLIEHFDTIVTDRAIRREDVAAHVRTLRNAERYLGRYIVNATSGTTSSPGFTIYDPIEWATVLASSSRFERHVGSLSGLIQRPKMALITSKTPWHISARIGTTIRSSILPMLRMDVGDPLDSIVDQLNAWQPHMLATYASMAGILAEEQAAGRLHIAPRRIICTAEVLTPTLRQRIEAIWGNVVFNQYAASEGGTLAVECESHAGLHIFEDLFIFEVVDHQNRPVPPGEYGEKVLLTVLYNKTQPLIRYEMSDQLQLSPTPCPCGCAFALIQDIRGRYEEVLHFPTIDGRISAVHSMNFYRILDAQPLNGWQVIQEPERLRLRLSGDPERVNQQEIVDSVRHALERQSIVVPQIVVEWIKSMPRGKTGKASHIVSNAAALQLPIPDRTAVSEP